MLQAASTYARMGLKVLPCRKDKSPATNNGVNGATLDPKLIQFLFDDAEAVGIAGGDGLLIIDEDRPGAVHELEERFGDLPMTVEAKTPRGGRHLYFRLPEGLEPKSTTSCIAQGIDTKGRGGYCVAPPSPGYTWVMPPDEQPIEDLPERWLEVIPSVDVSKHPRPRIPGEASGWVQRAIERVRDEGHGRNDTGFWLACQLRDLGVAIEDCQPAMIEYQKAVSPLNRQAYREKEALGALRSAFGHEPRDNPSKGKKAPQAAKENKPAVTERIVSKLQCFDSTELMNMHLEPLKYAVKGLVVEGLNIFGGASGYGKTLLALHMAACVASGKDFLNFQVEQGSVLFIDAETGRRSAQKRFSDLGWGTGVPGLFYWESNGWQIDDDGMEGLEAFRGKHPNLRMVIFDTLELLIPQITGGKTALAVSKMNSYEHGYNRLQCIARWAQEHRIAVMLVHHAKAAVPEGSEPYDLLMNARGLVAACQGRMVLMRFDETRFRWWVQLKDASRVDLMVERDGIHFKVLGDFETEAASLEAQDLLQFVRDHGRPVTPKEVAGGLDMNQAAARQACLRAAKRGWLTKVGYGSYTLNPLSHLSLLGGERESESDKCDRGSFTRAREGTQETRKDLL